MLKDGDRKFDHQKEGNLVAERTWGEGRMAGFYLGILGTINTGTRD